MKIKLMVLVGAFVFSGLFSIPGSASALVKCPDGTVRKGEEVNSLAECNVPEKDEGKVMNTVNAILTTITGLVGVAAVFMMIIGGISYVTSQGDTVKTKKAQNTILYGVVGLVISILSYAIVNFVLTNVFG